MKFCSIFGGAFPRGPLSTSPFLSSGEVSVAEGSGLELLSATSVLADRLPREDHGRPPGQAEPPVLPVRGGRAEGGGHQAPALPPGRWLCRDTKTPRMVLTACLLRITHVYLEIKTRAELLICSNHNGKGIYQDHRFVKIILCFFLKSKSSCIDSDF